MKRRVQKKVYFVGPGRNSISLVVPDRMHQALTELAKATNETIPGAIYDILELYLIEEGLEGEITWPEEVDKDKYRLPGEHE